MKYSPLVALAFCLFVGCGEPPVPTGPAAEASTAAIEITMDAPPMNGGLAIGE